MKVIPLTKGQVTVINNRDYVLVKSYTWCAQKTKTTYYAITTLPGGRRIYMHRLLMGITDRHIEVDHVDRNGLNNVRGNIRVSSRSQNRMNTPKFYRRTHVSRYGVSRFKGVGWDNYKKKFKAGCSGQFLGYFSSEIQAARAYDDKALELYGAFAHLNLGDR